MNSPFAQALGADFAKAPLALQTFHKDAGPSVFAGQADVKHGAGFLTKLGLRLGGFPPEGTEVPLQVKVSKVGKAEVWDRNFEGHVMSSSLTYDAMSGLVLERIGMLCCGMKVTLNGDRISVNIQRLWILGIRLPNRLVPSNASWEWQDEDGAFCFDIAAELPWGAPFIRYRGRLLTQL